MNMKIERWWLLTIAALSLSLLFVSNVRANDETRARFDILGFDATTNSIVAGGSASSTAADGSQITITARIFFEPNDSGDATGGGTWQTQDVNGAVTGSGTYNATRLDAFDAAPGTLVGAGVNDGIGNIADAHAGLAVFTIRYSDGTRGVLVSSCSLIGTPAAIFEGFTATKGAVDFAFFVPPAVGTAFHIRAED
jgi:hypothetical protein